MVPVFPLSVKVVLFVPLHAVDAPEMVPETDVDETVIVAEALFAAEQIPLVTTAL